MYHYGQTRSLHDGLRMSGACAVCETVRQISIVSMTCSGAGSARNAAANGAPAKQPLCFIVIPPRRRPSESGAALHRHRVFSSRVVSPAGIYRHQRSEEHTSELQSLMRISYAVFCLKNKKQNNTHRER